MNVAAAVEDVAACPDPDDEALRILMVAACPLPARRGTPLRVERLAGALDARGHHVELVTYHVVEDDAPLPVPVHRIFAARRRRMEPGPHLDKLFFYDPILAWKLRRLLARAPWDVLYAHHFEGLLAALAARGRRRIPIVYDAHTMLSSELPSYGPSALQPIVRRLGGWLDGAIPSLADHVVTVTTDIQSALIERHGIAPERITLIRNGVETRHFASTTGGEGRDPFRLIYTGTLAPYQDIDLLLRVFARVHRLRPELRLHIAASTPFGPYEEQARSLGIRDAIEVVPDDFQTLPARLASAAMALLPRTKCDGIPQKLLNYMASGTPVVASAGSAKVLEHERTGLVVPDGDVEAFARAILRLLDAPDFARQLGEAARAFVLANCTWETAAERAEQACWQVIQRTRQTEGEAAAKRVTS